MVTQIIVDMKHKNGHAENKNKKHITVLAKNWMIYLLNAEN